MSDTRPGDIADTDVFITRAFDAPRDVVFRFFMDPEHLSTWFGPIGLSTPIDTIVIEPVVGGRWELVMVDDSTGASYPMRGRIVELVEPELLVVVADAESDFGDLDGVSLRIQFHDHGDRTRITLHQGPFNDEAKHATEAGWLQSFGKIDAILATGTAPDDA